MATENEAKCRCCSKPWTQVSQSVNDSTLCRGCYRNAVDVWQGLRDLWFGKSVKP